MRKLSAQTARGEGTLSRRGVLGGLAAVPFVMYGVGSATPALAAATATRPGSVPTAADDLVRGAERRYNAPLLTAGTARASPGRRPRGRTSRPPTAPRSTHRSSLSAAPR